MLIPALRPGRYRLEAEQAGLNEVVLDGVPITGNDGMVGVVPSVDAAQEFKVQTKGIRRGVRPLHGRAVEWRHQVRHEPRHNRRDRGFDFRAACPPAAAAGANYAAGPIPEVPASGRRGKGGFGFAGLNGVPPRPAVSRASSRLR